MAKSKTGKGDGMDAALLPVKKEVRNLLEMFEFYLTERHLGKPIEALGDVVHDMRLIIGRLLVDHFLNVSSAEESAFCSALAAMLTDRASSLGFSTKEDQEYSSYCIAEILTSFEYAQEIKAAYPDDCVMQKILSLDIPVLRPFDYGFQGKLKLVKPKKLLKVHKS